MKRQNLLDDYLAELSAVQQFRQQGITHLQADTWDFTKTLDSEVLVPIGDIEKEIQRRVDILSNPDCSSSVIEELKN